MFMVKMMMNVSCGSKNRVSKILHFSVCSFFFAYSCLPSKFSAKGICEITLIVWKIVVTMYNFLSFFLSFLLSFFLSFFLSYNAQKSHKNA